MAKSNFGKALGRELGKNTGKLISNKLFGNGHATPYRVTGRAQAAQIKADAVNAQAEALKAQANAQFKAEKMRVLQERKQENKAREISAVGEIAKFEFSENPKEISSQLNQIISLINGEKSRTVLKAGMEKIDFGILNLRVHDSAQADYFEEKLKKLKFRYNFPYYSIVGVSSLVLLVILYFIGFGFFIVGLFTLIFIAVKLLKKK
jgi:hypothetical protein